MLLLPPWKDNSARLASWGSAKVYGMSCWSALAKDLQVVLDVSRVAERSVGSPAYQRESSVSG